MTTTRRLFLLNFPVEIIDEIISLVDRCEQVSLALTCKAVRKVALRRLFRCVRLRSSCDAQEFCEGVETRRDWMNFVNRLAIDIEQNVPTPRDKKHERLDERLATDLPLLPNLRDLDIRASKYFPMRVILERSTFPQLDTFSYIFSEMISDTKSIAVVFLSRHRQLTKLSLWIEDFTDHCPPIDPNEIIPKPELVELPKLRAFSGPSTFLYGYTTGNMPLVEVTLGWDLPFYPNRDIAVERPLRALAASSGGALARLNCRLSSWVPGVMCSIAKHFPHLQRLEFIQATAKMDEEVETEILDALPHFSALTTFSIDVDQCVLNIDRRSDMASRSKDLIAPMMAMCPSLKICNLYTAPRTDLDNVVIEMVPDTSYANWMEWFLSEGYLLGE